MCTAASITVRYELFYTADGHLDLDEGVDYEDVCDPVCVTSMFPLNCLFVSGQNA